MNSDEAFDLGPVPIRVPATEELARRLVASQFPQWGGLPIRSVAHGGWDNWSFHLGTHMVLRLPSAAQYAQAVDKEHRWLPALAQQLPQPIPVPLAKGAPDPDYPFAWSVYGWLDGQTATPERIADPVRFALDLADFLSALQAIDATGGPRPGVHNWFRGGPLQTYDHVVQQALEALGGRVDVGLAREVWANALTAPWDGTDRWFHGDVAQGNLLLTEGQLGAVIDFGTCGVGDPSCDLAVAWTLLPDDARQAFRDRLSVGSASWARGRGWALWKTLATLAQLHDDPDDPDDPDEAQELTTANRVLDAILSEYSADNSATRA